MGEEAHVPVLLSSVINQLAIRPDGWYIDATYGRGGHAGAILEQLGPDARLWLVDRDPDACEHARATYGADPRVEVVEDSFLNLPKRLEDCGEAQVHGLLLDLGVSSVQLNEPSRGFSFQYDGPLDMRMSRQGQTAAEWLQQAAESEITDVLYRFGEEPQARRIARAITIARESESLTRTTQLANLIAAVAQKRKRLHPATRSFQAIRIFINDELGQLRGLLERSLAHLAVDGRLAVISFHSLEDRMVKRFMKEQAQAPAISRHRPQPAFTPQLALVPLIRPDADEIKRNPRARSARLRVARRLA